MIEHWYEYLPAAWFIPEARIPLIVSVVLILLIGFAVGFWVGRRSRK